MRVLTATIRGTSPYSQSRAHETPKLAKETHEDYDVRTWREKCTVDEAGQVVIPAGALKQAIDTAASRLSIQIPGKGKATYTKHFVGGVNVFDDLKLGVRKDDVQVIKIHANADGVRGSGKRVWRHFPIIPAPWGGRIEISVPSDVIPDDVVEQVIRASGKFIGVGRFRPEKGGTNGRFEVSDLKWSETV